MKKGLPIVVVFLFASIAHGEDQTAGIASPDGNVQLMFVANDHQPTFTVTFKGKPVIEKAAIGFSLDGVDLTSQTHAGVIRGGYDHDEKYPTRGVHSTATDHHNGWRLPLTYNPDKIKFDIEVRAFNDGVAFRFIVPKEKGDSDKPRVPDELTTFTLPAGTLSWAHGLRGHYEGDYEKKDVSAYQKGDWVAPPITFKLPDGAGYASITESALINYSGMALESDGQRGFVTGLGHRQPPSYPYTLRYSKEDVERLSHPAAIAGEITTPWRVIVISADLNGLVNSDIINNLSPPPDPALFPAGLNTDWCKPGRAVWKYLDNPKPAATVATTQRERNPVTPEEMKNWSRLAGELGFEYNVLEGFWSHWSDEQIRDLVEYSKQRGVKLIVWVHSNRLHDPEARKALFKRCTDTGIAGLKIDFFDHEHKETMDVYQAILREAAAAKLVLVFHGANKPAGEDRTWPNELNREAIHGMEASRQPDRAFHETILPYTRFLAGHGDYTPMLFGDRRGNTTWAHQIALPVVFNESLITYAASPQHILENPAVEMIKSIPATWDQTIVLDGSEIGEAALFARRSGTTWFLGVVNGPQAKKLDVPLAFLADGSYRAMTVSDRPGDSASVEVKRDQPFDRSSKISLDLVAGGGYVARFTPVGGDSK